MNRRILLLAFLLGLSGMGAVPPSLPKDGPGPQVRVAVLTGVRTFTLAVNGSYTLRDAVTGQSVETAGRLPSSPVRASGHGLMIGNRTFVNQRLAIEPDRDATIVLNGRRFRGTMTVIGGTDGVVTAVNVIDLEDYIKGVLYHEVSHKWPMDALMAQAVAARTYALYQKDQHQGKPYDYDLTSDIYSQVYGGKTSEHYRTGIAVDRTRGLVLMYQGKILPAYFHACCAGHTEDAHELWDIDIPPLKGVACPYCRTSPHYRWQRNFRLKDIQDALNKNGIKIGLIKGIAILEHDPSGRIRKLKITARDGKAVTVAGKDFRNWIGPNVIRSNNYEIVMQGYYMDLIGKGWGHGVGFCQWGAFTLASQGWDFRRILKYYYPQSEIVSADALP